MVASRPKSELLNNIELLWNEASMQSEDHAHQNATSTFQRINLLMQDALTVEQAANDAVAPDPDPSLDDDIDALAALVQDAAAPEDTPNSAAMAAQPMPFEQVKSQMEDVSRLKPPQEDSYNISSVEYDFGQAFTNLVRHVVRDYIHNEVETVIRNAISSELNAHFSKQHDATLDGEDKK